MIGKLNNPKKLTFSLGLWKAKAMKTANTAAEAPTKGIFAPL